MTPPDPSSGPPDPRIPRIPGPGPPDPRPRAPPDFPARGNFGGNFPGNPRISAPPGPPPDFPPRAPPGPPPGPRPPRKSPPRGVFPLDLGLQIPLNPGPRPGIWPPDPPQIWAQIWGDLGGFWARFRGADSGSPCPGFWGFSGCRGPFNKCIFRSGFGVFFCARKCARCARVCAVRGVCARCAELCAGSRGVSGGSKVFLNKDF